MTDKNRLLRIKEVLEITGLSKSILYELKKRGEFPSPLRIGRRAVGWREEDIDNWLDSLPPATEENWR